MGGGPSVVQHLQIAIFANLLQLKEAPTPRNNA
jgi:hypothetical protein